MIISQVFLLKINVTIHIFVYFVWPIRLLLCKKGCTNILLVNVQLFNNVGQIIGRLSELSNYATDNMFLYLYFYLVIIILFLFQTLSLKGLLCEMRFLCIFVNALYIYICPSKNFSNSCATHFHFQFIFEHHLRNVMTESRLEKGLRSSL